MRWRQLSIIGTVLVLCASVVAFATVNLDAPQAAQLPTNQFSVSQLWQTVVERKVGEPTRLRIPTIGVDAQVEHVGQTASGAMHVPKAWQNVAWYKLGARPGEQGNAVIAGPLDSDNGKAVFWDLHLLKPGNTIEVDDDRGVTRTFVVTDVRRLLDEEAPIQEIFGPSDGVHLNLITCGGTWDEKTQRYSKRLIVFTTLQT